MRGIFKLIAGVAVAALMPSGAHAETPMSGGTVIWYSRIVAHVPQMKGWKITPTHFANHDLPDIWLDQ